MDSVTRCLIQAQSVPTIHEFQYASTISKVNAMPLPWALRCPCRRPYERTFQISKIFLRQNVRTILGSPYISSMKLKPIFARLWSLGIFPSDIRNIFSWSKSSRELRIYFRIFSSSVDQNLKIMTSFPTIFYVPNTFSRIYKKIYRICFIVDRGNVSEHCSKWHWI